ncbi:DUF4870 domain-containing protein [Chitinophaga sp. 30R24]|uniref:DUF4870 domain-containing protein n=1 Tax=Chitinophaga sp. 30R24 TaxID=3248838 RepID=UPI003B91A73F
MNQRDERTWGTLVHLGGLIGMAVLPSVGNIIGVLILWLIKRSESVFVDDQGKEAINFQITLSILGVVLNIIRGALMGLRSLTNFWTHSDIFTFSWSWSNMFGVVWVINIVFSIIAAVKASNGISYRYPLSLRLVK